MSRKRYTQCLLEHVDTGARETAWIVADKAVKGAIVDVGEDKHHLTTVRVLEVYSSTDRDMPRFQNDYSKAKRRTDI